MPARTDGRSFIADWQGVLLHQMGCEETGLRVRTFDLDELRAHRQGWGVFRDRRPEMYRGLLTHDGRPDGAPAGA